MSNQIVLCPRCNQPEFKNRMRWYRGVYSCRHCYKSYWEEVNNTLYGWSDLEGERPTKEQYDLQQSGVLENENRFIRFGGENVQGKFSPTQ